MHWVYYGVAAVATVLACLLWLFVFGVLPRAGSVPAPAPVAVPVPPGRLPVPPKLRPADETRAILFRDLQAGRAVCVGGFYARQALDPGGVSYAVQIWVDGRRVPCP